ncbi:MAG: hypothetical protein VXZ51_00115 [Actinomycetota bacterium]|nr:hypothetical protein [Actinomycetota bacterium]
MKYFGEIQDEHAELVETKPSVLKLSMQGVKKLLPYKGFYPSQRTVQIAQIFSQSFSPGVDNDAAITALNQPLFGPGILFNSIKSGIACDWLTYTASAPRVDEQWSPWYVDGADLAKGAIPDINPMIIPLRDSTRVQPIRNNETQPGHFQTSQNTYYTTSSIFDYFQWHSRHPDSGSAYMSLDLEPSIRLPFETIVSPQRFFPKPIVDETGVVEEQAGLSYIPPMVPGLYFNSKYNQYPVTGNFDGTHDQRYELAINNFLAETARFFLEEGTFTSFASAPEKDFDLMVSGTTYYMDITLRKTKDFVMYEGPNSLGGWFPSVLHYANVDAFNSLEAPGIEVPQVYKYQGTNNAPNATSDIFPWSGVGDECTGSHIMAEGPYMFMPGVNSAKGMHYGPSMRAFSASFLSEFYAGQYDDGGNTGDGYNITRWHRTGSATSGFAFGGDIAARAWALWTKNFTDPSFAPYTPPYFYGDSTARFRFTPHLHFPMSEGEAQKFSLDEILAGARKETVYMNDNESAFNKPKLHAGYGTIWHSSGSHNVTTVWHDKGSGGNISRTGSVSIDHWLTASSYQNEFNGVISPEGVTDYENTSLARKHQMKLNSSLSLFEKTREKKVIYDPTSGEPRELEDPEDSNLDVWSIHTKWECPVLDFSDNSTTMDFWSNGSPTIENNFNRDSVGTATRGMWKGYGTSPDEDQGIFLEIKESFPTVVEDNNLPRIGGDRDPSTTNVGATGSLIQTLGFQTEQKKIGRVRESKIISEAVVAIPFYRDESDAVRFFHLGEDNMTSRALFNVAAGISDADLNPGDSIIEMADRMSKYIIPPHLDFSMDQDIQPFAMYIFPFTHVLSRKDLENIWQGIMPDISVTAEKQEVSVAHNLDENEFFRGENIPAATRWMVFKVKQRAERDYERIIKDTRDDPRYEFQFDLGTGLSRNVTYNWPYDYFSLVELGRLDASVRIGGEPLMLRSEVMRNLLENVESPTATGFERSSNILSKTQDLVEEAKMTVVTADDPVLAATEATPAPVPKKLNTPKKALPKKMLTKKEKKDRFNKKQPESSPLYKIKKAESKAGSNEPGAIGAGFATKKDLITAAKAGMKKSVKAPKAPQDDALKF